MQIPARDLPTAIQRAFSTDGRARARALFARPWHFTHLRLATCSRLFRTASTATTFAISDQLNPEIGTEADLEKLVNALRENKMGLVLDIVPNHMGIASPENLWWWDVLKNGRASKFAKYFDIDWNSSDPKLRGKILVPILGGEYERVLERGELRIGARAARLRGGEPGTRGRAVRAPAAEFVLRYCEHEFPLAPDSISVNISVEQLNSNPAALDELIQRQNYRLAFWRDGDLKLNYRRFFAVSTLAALRIEDAKVFNDVHALIENGSKTAGSTACAWTILTACATRKLICAACAPRAGFVDCRRKNFAAERRFA